MDPQRAKQLLSQERIRIEEELRRLQPPAADDRLDVVRDSADSGSDLFEEERDAGLTESLQERRGAVERAEQRLAAGTFGLSVQSGDRIPDERLEFDPTVELTVEEQKRLEGER